MLCCLNIYCDGNEGNPVNPDTARRCQYCKQSLIPLLRNRFKPLKVLGQGGFGRTYLAEDQDNLNSYCVLKQLMPQGGSKAVELFQREAQQLQTLGQDNPQIPSLIAFFSENNALFLVQQFIEGTSLQKELDNQGTWQAAAVIQFLKEILPILQFIHQRSVIHRDIKPDNIMRRRDTGQIVLIDFGLSKSMKGSVLALPGTRAGSYGYVPLEQMEDGEAYPASDLFSLGATCFHLLSGIYPHSLWLRQGYGWVNNWQSHISQPLPPALTRVLDKLLREEYTRRYQSAQDVLNRLNAPGDNAPGQPPPPTFQPDPVPPVKTRPTVVAVPPQAAKRPVQPNPPVKVPPSPQKRAVAVPPQPIKRPVQPNPPVKATPSPQNQSLPAADWQTLLLWLVALGGSYGLLSLYQVGQEALFVAVFSDPDDVSGATSLTRIFWLGGGLVLGLFTGPVKEKQDEIVPCVAGVVAVAVAFSVAGHFAVIVVVLGALVLAWFVPLAGAIALAGGAPWAEVWAKAGALARAVAWTLAVAWAWAGAGVLTWAEAWAEYGAFFGTQLLMSTLVHLWAIAHPQNPHRWRSGVMIVLSVAGGIFCFNRALAEGDSIIVFAEGDPILPGVVLGASSLGIIALVVATLVGAGRGLRRSTGLGYWGRWAVMAVPIVLGAVLGWGIYGIVPWAEWLL